MVEIAWLLVVLPVIKKAIAVATSRHRIANLPTLGSSYHLAGTSRFDCGFCAYYAAAAMASSRKWHASLLTKLMSG